MHNHRPKMPILCRNLSTGVGLWCTIGIRGVLYIKVSLIGVDRLLLGLT
jgi:hypothetical protein